MRDVFATLPESGLERVKVTEETLALQAEYLEAWILGPASSEDALHVAIATVAEVDLIVSWNFRHIVHYDKIRQFNAVNLFKVYSSVDIRSPREVV